MCSLIVYYKGAFCNSMNKPSAIINSDSLAVIAMDNFKKTTLEC